MEELIVHTGTGTLDKGVLMAHLDGELPPADAEQVTRHLRECLPCRQALEGARARAGSVSSLLAVLDRPAPTAEAWRRVQAEIAPGAPKARPAPRQPVWRLPLARAAGVVLVLAGGAAAAIVPGSPLREWISGPDEPAALESSMPAEPTPEAGTRAALLDGTIDVALSVPVGTEIVVAWSGTGRAGVFGSAIASFDSPDEGRLRADATGGPLRVEIPTDVVDATLRVNGVVVLTIREGEVGRIPEGAEGALERAGEPLRFDAR